jgi:RHS repeat-associated protein
MAGSVKEGGDMGYLFKTAAFVITALSALVITPGFAQEHNPGIDIPSGVGELPSLGAAHQNDLFNGSFSYTIPIEVPPGTNGMAPRLAVVYNSDNKNGSLGVGWRLSGLGLMKRSTKKGVPGYDSSDSFLLSLDGIFFEDLIYTGQDPSGKSGNYYQTEIQSFLRILYDPNNRWYVTDKAGVQYRFGYNSDSNAKRPSGETKAWFLDEIRDTHGNYMSITYINDQGFTYPSLVTYTQGNGLSTFKTVQFIYEVRPDPRIDYTMGAREVLNNRLISVDVRVGGNLVRRYALSYSDPSSGKAESPDTGQSLLRSVQVFGSDGITSLPPHKFDYTQLVHNLSSGIHWDNISVPPGYTGLLAYSRSYNSNGYSYVYVTMADMNGDGRLDKIKIDEVSGAWQVYINNGSGLNNPISWPSTVGYAKMSYSSGGYNYLKADLLDINGDGKADLVVAGSGSWQVYFSNGAGFDGPLSWPGVPADHLSKSSGGYTYTSLMDMNGDRLPDLVITGDTGWQVYKNTGSAFDPVPKAWGNPSGRNYLEYSYGIPSQYSNQYENIVVQTRDMNGDGLPDLVVAGNPISVYFNKGDGFDNGTNWSNPANVGYLAQRVFPHSGLYAGIGYFLKTGLFDINGDGRPDLLLMGQGGGTFCCGGSSTVRPEEAAINMRMYTNTGSGFGASYTTYSFPQALCILNQALLSAYQQNNTVLHISTSSFMDINGDLLPDFVDGCCNPENPVFLNNSVIPDLLSHVTNNLGGSLDITYNPSTVYDNTGGDGKPDLPFIKYVAASITQGDGRVGFYTTKYFYGNGRYSPEAKEFRGFGYVRADQMRDSQNYEKVTETWFLQDPVKKGKIQTEITTSRVPEGYQTGHQRRVDNTWQERTTTGGRVFPYLYRSLTTVTDAGAVPYTLDIYYAYDDYGNRKEEHRYGSTNEEQIHTYSVYTNFVDPWILSKPREITVKDYLERIVSHKWMAYNQVNGDLFKEEVCKSDNPNGYCQSSNESQNSVTEYEQYSVHGNLLKKKDSRGYRTIFTYDTAYQTHIYTTKNCLEVGTECPNYYHLTTTVYDPGTGNLIQLVSPHLQGTGLAINYTYDALGRKTLESRPDGGSTEYFYLDFGNPQAQRIRKKEHIVGGISVPDHYTSTYFDGTGRTYRVANSWPAVDPESKWTDIMTVYDPLIPGRISSKSNPYICSTISGCDPVYTTIFTYDGLSRVTRVEIPDTPANRYIRTTYQGLKKIVENQRGYSTAYTYDVHQRLKKVEDHSGTATEYSYDTLGNLIQVKAAVGMPEQNITTMTYDSQSKKRTMNDPDMGYWQYTYDKSGNLISQTDGKNQTITFTYDGLNRLTQKIYPDRTVTFSYDEIPYSKGKLTRISDPSGGETKEDSVLEYDLMQRVKRGQKKIGTYTENWATFEKTYDSSGRVISITYPGGRIYSYAYDAAGNLLYLKENATQTNLVTYSNFTALSQPGLATFSNGVSTTYSYYPQTGRPDTLFTNKLSTVYQNLSYDGYDENGNIKTVTDGPTYNHPVSISHSYTYDALDRLYTAIGAGSNPYSRSYEYDRIGNIKSNSDVGTYIYDYLNKPHAVKSILAIRSIYTDSTINIVYNYDQKPISITGGSGTTSFTYDGNGQRVKKVSPSETVYYFGEFYEKRGSTRIINLFAGNRRVASVWLDVSGNPQFTQFYHPDHLGSTNVVTDQNGNRAEWMEYFPFGTYRVNVDYASGFPDVFYTYTGQEDDFDLEFYNYKARLYDPLLGRFISPDSLVPDPEDPQALNRYAYARNNPLLLTDPSGGQYETYDPSLWSNSIYDYWSIVGNSASEFSSWSSNFSWNTFPPIEAIANSNINLRYNPSNIDTAPFNYVSSNPVSAVDQNKSATRDSWFLKDYVQFGGSQSLLFQGTSISGRIEQKTESYLTIIGNSLDIYIGPVPSPCYRTYEIGVGFRHIGLGYFYGNPDASGYYQSWGLAIHLGLGVSIFPGYFTVTQPIRWFKVNTGPAFLEKQR